MNDNPGRAKNAQVAVITPEILSASLRINGPEGPFLIKGVAREIRPWTPRDSDRPRYVYGTLGLGEYSVRFRADPGNAPIEGEAVVLSATLEIKPAKIAGRDRWYGGYDATLIAEKVGGWEATPHQRSAIQLTSRADRLPLLAFFDDHTSSDLTILVSENADADIRQAFTAAGLDVRPNIVQARFDSEDAIIQAAREAIDNGAQAIALARGGGAGLELIANSPKVTEALLSLDCPFYSAQGHGRDVFLLDKHADESFATPSVLGAVIARALRESAGRRRDWEELARLRQRELELQANAEQSKANAELAERQLASEEAIRARKIHADARGVSVSWPVAASLGGILAFLLALLYILMS